MIGTRVDRYSKEMALEVHDISPSSILSVLYV